MNLRDVFCSTRTRLTAAGIADAELDARLLLEHFAGANRTDFALRPDAAISDEAIAVLDAAIARRLAGEPVHRIIGEREFYGLPLRLSRETLEPRPDTETLVDAVLPFVKQRFAETGACRIVDLGTGTGAIALALLSQAPEATAVGVDISDDALATAASNAEINGLSERFTAQKSDWFSEVSGRFDLIVSNPPYIRSEVIPTLSREVREHDPVRALDGGPDGLGPYRIIAESGEAFLASGGMIGVEIGYDQLAEVSAIFVENQFSVTSSFKDFGGNYRVILFQKR